MSSNLRSLAILVLSVSLTAGTFAVATTALHPSAEEVDPVESAIKNAHSDPPARLVQA